MTHKVRQSHTKGKFYIGTSGWHYEHWKGTFYPVDLSAKRYFSYYINFFSTVEINRTFYNLPSKKVFFNYAKNVSSNFIFSIKASRFITHVKYLKSPTSSLKRLFTRIEALGSHLGPILFQLPPRWKVDLERLEHFLKVLPKEYRYALEFREPSWMIEEVFELLQKYDVAFCIYELDHFKAPSIVTTDFIYVRLHGPGKAYSGKYSLEALKQWANYFQKKVKKGVDVYCYFDNDQAGYAVQNAITLKKLLKT